MGYEFNESENRIVSDLAAKMSFVGTCSVVFGGIQVLGGFALFGMAGPGVALGYLLQGFVSVVVGYFARSSARAFRMIVDTKGDDVHHLLQALGGLGRIYGIQRFLYAVALVMIACTLAYMLLTLRPV